MGFTESLTLHWLNLDNAAIVRCMKISILNLIVRNFFKISIALIILSVFLYIMMPFMIAIILGGILAMALMPFVDFFMRRGLSRNNSLLVFSLLLGIVGLIPLIGFFMRGSRVISELLHESNFSIYGQKIINSSFRFFDHVSSIYGLDNLMVRTKMSGAVISFGNYLSSIFSTFISELPTIFMLGFMSILSVYFFLRESDKIRAIFDRYFYFSKKNGDEFINMCKVCCREVFLSNILTGILQSSIVSLGALVFDVGDFFLIFFITFVVSFIPVVGAAPVAGILAIICFVEARIGAGIGMMIIAMVSGLSDNILRPYLGSIGSVEVHPFIGLLAVIGGVIMFGLPGLFIGPLVASLSFGALPIIINEYFQPVEDDVWSDPN